jgi:hypothetical protein
MDTKGELKKKSTWLESSFDKPIKSINQTSMMYALVGIYWLSYYELVEMRNHIQNMG